MIRRIDFVGLFRFIYVNKISQNNSKCQRGSVICYFPLSHFLVSMYPLIFEQVQLSISCCTFQNTRNQNPKCPWHAPPLGRRRSEVIYHIQVFRRSVHVQTQRSRWSTCLHISHWPSRDTSRIITDPHQLATDGKCNKIAANSMFSLRR